ncbi:four helix bundle protein [Candidatus Micrarchaeota archaeon CG_4_10_14_0_2_um_filter_60_11]|nr:MAG: four helix bundle protein [Candidatus Micrarchaeota archaeon CG_4_10_14_0_2_um_filter_60_11]
MDNKEYKRQLIKKAYKFSLNIISFIDSLEKKDYSVQVISKQLLRSATSIGANIVEAQAASSKRDFINFLNHALKSGNETKFWLGLLRDSKKSDRDRSNILLKNAEYLSKILGSSLLELRNKKL